MTTKLTVALKDVGFHAHAIAGVKTMVVPETNVHLDAKSTYTLEPFFHPYVGALLEALNKGSIAEMLDPDVLQTWTTSGYFRTFYTPDPESDPLVDFASPDPVKKIDLRIGGSYSLYNVEALLHFPFAVAVHLSKNQRFAEAMRWFHLIFDPTCADPLPPPERFWRFLGFRYPQDPSGPQRLDELLVLLSKPPSELTADERVAKDYLINGYRAIARNPFQPHAVARTRPVAYQYAVVMKYLDNLIAWGDSLFSQYTVESINEATMLYVLASNLLGERPQQVPPRGTVRTKSFAELNAPLRDSNGNVVLVNGAPVRGIDEMGNALVELEAQFPFNFSGNASQPAGASPLFGIGRTLYFCIPPNDKLLGYWDVVADRLFKIRHCMDIAGVVRPLALFDPPLDPGLLVKAAASGIDLGNVVSGLAQPIGPVRCQVLIQKALELAGEVRGLGNALLAALEKGDGERLALVRQAHEVRLLQLSQEVRFLQWQQAQAATESLLRSRDSALERYKYYLRLLGQQVDTTAVPETLELDRRELTQDNFDDAYEALVAQYDKAVATQSFAALALAGESSPSNQSGATGAGSLYLNSNEDAELNKHLPKARDARTAASAISAIGAVVTFIPDIGIKAAFWGLGADARVFGGEKMSNANKFASEVAAAVGAWEQDQAGMASKTAGYQRRADEWILQANLAARELVQTGRQIIASLITEQAARREYLNTQTQIEQSEEVSRFLQAKFTNEELYGWMQGEISRLFYEYYRFAVDVARKAETTMKHELMRPEVDGTSFIRFNYWDGGRKGLLSGDALQLDIKRMEMAYLDNNKRELEITRHVSLRQLAPLALLELKLTGTCEVEIPEWLYDLDCPGHYMRRIKTVAVSIPAVVGPTTTLNSTVTLLRSSVRTKPILRSGAYAREPAGDDRFVDYVGAMQSIVTSGGTNDSGMFETNLRDERFLPFEGAGAISTWRIELPKTFPQFNHATIADVILHVRYTARAGGELLATQAKTELAATLQQASTGLALLFSLRHDFPTEWAAYLATNSTKLVAQLKREYFPYFAQGRTITVEAVELHTKAGRLEPSTVVADLTSELATGPVNMALDLVPKDPAADVFLSVRYSVAP